MSDRIATSLSTYGKRVCLALAAFVTTMTPAVAAADATVFDTEKLKVFSSGQVRIRALYHGGLDLGPGQDSDVFTQRARFGLGADIFEIGRLFIQIQDVRTWGEEIDTLGDFVAGGLDMHQAYLQLTLAKKLVLRAGRMEIAFDAHRLIGNVGWTDQGRSFDAALAKLSVGPVELQAWYAKLGEADVREELFNDKDVGGFWAHLGKWKTFAPSLILVIDRDGTTDKLRATFGYYIDGRVTFGRAGALTYTVEGYEQLGKVGNADVRATLAAVLVGYTLPWRGIGIDLRGEVLTGDEDPTDDKITVFDTLYPTNHKFYGYMDFFLNIPVHTGGRGLLDFGARLRATPWKGGVVMADWHHFMAAVGDDPDLFGDEVDFTVKHEIHKGIAGVVGYSFFVPGDGMPGARGGWGGVACGDPGRTCKIEHFAYAMLGASF